MTAPEVPSVLRSPAEGVEYLFKIDTYIAALETEVARAKAIKYELETAKLPELFDNFDEVKVTTGSGVEAAKKLYVTGSLPRAGEKDTPEETAAKEALRQRGLEWASSDDVGWGPLIKTTVNAAYDKGDRARALEVAERLRHDNEAQPVVKVDETIHPMTLQAQVRKRLEAGKDVPTDILGITAITAVKLTRKPKEAQRG